MRIPLIDNIPIVGPLVNDVVDGTTPLGGGPVKKPAAVEAKVAAATIATSAVTLVMAFAGPLLAKLPAPLRWLVQWALPPIVTAVAGYLAPHTTRK